MSTAEVRADILPYSVAGRPVPVALLTNGSLLGDAEVRAAAANANVVKVSLSAGEQSIFEYINQPHQDLTIEALVDGIKIFRNEFDGELWLEVFVAWGVNSTPKDISQIAEWAKTFAPDRIQLNTAVRPPAESFVYPMPKEKLEQLADYFSPKAEVIAEFSSDFSTSTQANEETILSMLRRRPCTSEETAATLGLHLNEVSKYIGKLERTGRIHAQPVGPMTYYSCAPESVANE